jgi:type II secretory pathway pseudopilin PulG
LTLVEILVAIMVLTFLLALAIPAFYSMLRRSQLDAAARQLVSDLREAQSKATLTGWQYRLVGFDINNTGTFKNQYRLVGRSSSAVAWPADTSPTFTSATQMANPWINVNTVYPGVRLDTSDATDRFFVSFDARGAAFEINSFPLQVLHESGAKQCVGVTTAGNIRTQGCP